MATHQFVTISEKKRKAVFIILGFTLLLAGSVFSADWMNYFNKTSSLYPAIAKPCITLLAFLMVLIAGRHKLDRRDWVLLTLAFCCMLPTDILIEFGGGESNSFCWRLGIHGGWSTVDHRAYFSDPPGGAWTSLSEKIPTQRNLAAPGDIRLGCGHGCPPVDRSCPCRGHAVIGPIYTAFFCTTMWFAWETVRRRLYPVCNAWFVALAATCWYATEILGEIYNLGLGTLSNITFGLVWVFYGANVVFWALSGYRWHSEKKTH